MTPAQYDELEQFKRAMEALLRDLDNSPYFDDEIRDGLEKTVQGCEKQLKTAPVS